MASRSATTERKLSFDVLCNTASLPEEDPYEYSLHLHRSKSGPQNIPSPNQKRKRNKKRKKKKKNVGLDDDDSINSNDDINDSSPREPFSMIPKDPATETSLSAKDYSSMDGSHRDDGVVLEENRFIYSGEGSVTCTVGEVYGSGGELRQRNVTSSGSLSSLGAEQKEEPAVPFLGTEEVASVEKENKKVANGSVVDDTVSSSASTGIAKLETSESLDWKRLMAENPNYLFSVEQSPFKYFMEEMYKGNSLRNTTTFGSEKERERVYDTIFRLPWRCEMLIDVGFFVCFDSFLSLLTVMPTRIVMTFWRILNTRQFKKPSAAELSDIGCFIVLACGVVLLGRTDISLIYHMIRGQGTIKLYVVYNVLEIFDKLCQSFGGDVLQTLFNSAEGLASSSPENLKFWIRRFIYDQALATAFSILHSFILLAQAITLSTCIVAHNNALLALLVSNNFAEIKSNVFKRFSKDNIHSLVYSDSVERFHISAFLVFVLAQNILEAEGPWFESFLSNALMVYFCEMLIDIIKHSFLAKFNDLKPIAYSEFLEELCNQTLDIQTDSKKKTLTFVPLAPACVVIRVLTPVYAAHLPYSPLLWRLFWMFLLFSMTYVMLTSLKIMIGMCLQKHAGWYVNRCRRRKHHLHFD